jgi:hypothetical protein
MRTGTSSAASASTFTYQTVTSSTIFSSNSTTMNGTTISKTIASVSTSTYIATWSQGQPIPVSMVETGNFSLPGGIAYAFDSSINRMYFVSNCR